ncbi:hypothetical protein BKA62DRAFT_772436 [Auriculariales sp. MPI-PUGE-AT-0066]|nr:hypothetical protein BKA62DRAFT_772436 [Auriculariales sp. MPI-PUGE-AT-0066]
MLGRALHARFPARHSTPIVVRQREGFFELPLEILLHILTFLVCSASPYTPVVAATAWEWPVLRRQRFIPLMRTNKAWRMAAEVAFYCTIDPANPTACAKLARTLTRRPHLALLVRAIRLPVDALLVGQSVPFESHSIRNSYRTFKVNQQRRQLEADIRSILDACVNADALDIPTGMETFPIYESSPVVQGRVRALTLDSHGTTFSAIFVSPALSPWTHLETLRVHRVEWAIFADNRADGKTIRLLFPNLCALVLMEVYISRLRLEDLLVALRPTLRTLALISPYIMDIPSRWSSAPEFHPLAVLNDMPDEALSGLDDIRINANRRSYEPWVDDPTRRVTRWAAVTHLAIGSDQLRHFLHVPASLERLTVHQLRVQWPLARRLEDILTTTGFVTRSLASWRSQASRLQSVLLQAENSSLMEWSRWQLAGLILRELASRCGVEAQADISFGRLFVKKFRESRQKTSLLQYP